MSSFCSGTKKAEGEAISGNVNTILAIDSVRQRSGLCDSRNDPLFHKYKQIMMTPSRLQETFLLIALLGLFIEGCDTGSWYDPGRTFEPASYADYVTPYRVSSSRMYFDEVAVENSQEEAEKSIWALGDRGPICFSSVCEDGPSRFPLLKTSLYVSSSGSYATVVLLAHRAIQEPDTWSEKDFFVLTYAHDVRLEKKTDYVSGNFVGERRGYFLKDGSLVPFEPEEVFPPLKESIWFQIKLSPLPDNQDEILKKAKDEFGEVIRLFFEQVGE
jgi:hypothetical protein